MNVSGQNFPVDGRRGVTLIELLVYIVLFSAFMLVAFDTYFSSKTVARGIQWKASAIIQVMYAGERWRQDIREATHPPEWIENGRLPAPVLRLVLKTETIEYIFQDENFFRRNSEGAKELVLSNVRASRMIDDPRGEVPSVRWEVELKSRKEHRQTKPLFTFEAVPGLP